jgi:PhnB protein
MPYPMVMPYLSVDGAEAAIAYYTEVLGAREVFRVPGPDGRVGHAELAIGDSTVMLSDEWREGGVLAPTTIGGTATTLMVWVADVDAVFTHAIERGATVVHEPADQFYGDRSGQFLCPWGHRWNVYTQVEDVSREEMLRRAAELMGTGTGPE